MSISGTLETFSLPEIFRLIDSGAKSGRLIFQSLPTPTNPESQLYYLWFEKGRLVAISDRLNPQSLMTQIIAQGWLAKDITSIDCSNPPNKSLGFHLKNLKLLTAAQLRTLFLLHLDIVYQLFEISAAWFQFDEISEHSKAASLQTMPWLNMTGESIRATEVVLNALRSQKNWQIFAEHLPEDGYALQKLVSRPEWQLLPLESQIWELANGRVSLGAIANKINYSFPPVQRAAFRLIMAGLADEIPMANSPFSSVKPSQPNLSSSSRQTVTHSLPQTVTEDRSSKKSGVSFSLLQNLLSFLRKKLW
jgi:hypothetical protein